MRKHYVTFLSPGMLVSETTTRPIDAWDPAAAIKLGRDIIERHGARLYGFYFTTALAADPIDDGEGGTLNVQPKTVARSGAYFLGGELLKYDDVSESERILRDNMSDNGWSVVVENANSYRATHPFRPEDYIVDRETGEIVRRGTDPDLVAYCALMTERWKSERAAMVERWIWKKERA